jgi:hypothetical protein
MSMQPERAAGQSAAPALVEWLAGILFDLAGDQDVRVIEALAAVLARQSQEEHDQPYPGLSEAAAPPRFVNEVSGPDTAVRHAICQRIARRALRGSLVDPTRGATAVHRIDVSPPWSRDLLPIGMFGPFLFYRPTATRVQTSAPHRAGSSSREWLPLATGS